ncbi:MAG TPA: hypothetical protein VFP12_04040 [Allosphingosinicella sp.]|nr:hypothetical protein [Allosphingosinicella sp.]
MNQKQRENTDEATSERPRTEWTSPEVNRLEAGAAEFGDVSSADAQPGFS